MNVSLQWATAPELSGRASTRGDGVRAANRDVRIATKHNQLSPALCNPLLYRYDVGVPRKQWPQNNGSSIPGQPSRGVTHATTRIPEIFRRDGIGRIGWLSRRQGGSADGQSCRDRRKNR